MTHSRTGDRPGQHPEPSDPLDIVAGVDEELAERVREVILAIPPGEVLSYGEVAARAGVPSARQIGRLLSEDGQDLPWHRVVKADGRFAPHLAVEQTQRLRAEGVNVLDGRVRR
jgi:alkylated DNA nucleotide flippase Atl1